MQLLVCVNFYHSSRTLMIGENEPLRRLMQDDKSAQEFRKTTSILLLHYTSLLLFVSLCALHLPRPFLTTWWSVYCQAIWSVMLFTPPSSQKEEKKNRSVTRYDDLPRYCVSLASLSHRWGQPSKVCLCICCFCVCPQFSDSVCIPQALCCCIVMLSVTVLWPEPCSQRNQLWSWQVCLQHLTYTLSSPRHKHTHAHATAHTSWSPHENTHSFSGLRFKYTCRSHPHPPHPHISTDHHTSCRLSHSCQQQIRCKRNTLAVFWFIGEPP